MKFEFNDCFTEGCVDLETAELVCISKHKYRDVHLAIKDGMNYTVAGINEKWNSFEDRTALGNEIEKRWNAYPEMLKKIDELETIITKWRMK